MKSEGKNGMLRYLMIFLLGGLLYGLIEIIWRGYTHWSMVLTGGFCFCAIYFVEFHINIGVAWKALICAVIITAAEFTVGILVNKIWDLHVWDYSDMPLNVAGQICPTFSVIWYGLSFPALALCKWIGTTLFVKLSM